MFRFLVVRTLAIVPIMMGVALVVFWTLRFIPGDAISMMLGEFGSPEVVAARRAAMGLDRPWYVQLSEWLFGVLRGDFGYSLRTGLPVFDEVVRRIPATLQLTGIATILVVFLGVPPGIIAAIKRNSTLDIGVRLVSFVGLTVPSFWLGLLLILAFSLTLRWFPSGGYVALAVDPWEALKHTFLPALALALPSAATIMRFTRSAMLEVLSHDYIRTARSKGVTPRGVFGKHALRNALISVITVLGLQVGMMLGGSIAVEYVFRWPGLGQLTFSAISNRDYTIAQGASLFIALFFALASFAVDILYTYVDPRIQYE